MPMIHLDWQLSEDVLMQDNFTGKAQLRILGKEGAKHEGFAEINLAEGALTFHPANSSASDGELLSFISETFSPFSDGLDLELSMWQGQSMATVFFRLRRARARKLPLMALVRRSAEPFEVLFSDCTLGPVPIPDKFVSCGFNFRGMENLIGGGLIKWENMDAKSGSFRLPDDIRREKKSRALDFTLEVMGSSGGGYDVSGLRLKRSFIVKARFAKSVSQSEALDKIASVARFAGILQGQGASPTRISLYDADNNRFRLRARLIQSGCDEVDEFANNRGVFLDALPHFDHYAEFYKRAPNVFHELAWLPQEEGALLEDKVVSLCAVAESLCRLFRGKPFLYERKENGKKGKKYLASLLVHISETVAQYFREVPDENFLKELVRHRNAKAHEAKMSFTGDNQDDMKIMQQNEALLHMLRAFVLHECGVPRKTILKAMGGTGRGTSFYGLRPQTPDNTT